MARGLFFQARKARNFVRRARCGISSQAFFHSPAAPWFPVPTIMDKKSPRHTRPPALERHNRRRPNPTARTRPHGPGHRVPTARPRPHGPDSTDPATRTRSHGLDRTDRATRTRPHGPGHTDPTARTRPHGPGYTDPATRTKPHGPGHTDPTARTRPHGPDRNKRKNFVYFVENQPDSQNKRSFCAYFSEIVRFRAKSRK
jgi:hypothetical protein